MMSRLFILLTTALACVPTVALARRSGGGLMKYVRIPRDLDDPMMTVVIVAVLCLFGALILKLISRRLLPGSPVWQVCQRVRMVLVAGFVLAFGTFTLDAMQKRSDSNEESAAATVRYVGGETGGAKFVTARQ